MTVTRKKPAFSLNFPIQLKHNTHTLNILVLPLRICPNLPQTRISSCLPTSVSLILDTKVKTHSLTWSYWSPLHSTWLEADPGGKITLFNAYYIDLLRNSCNLDGIEINSGNIQRPNPGLLENMLAAGLWLHCTWSQRLREYFHLGNSQHPRPSARRTLC